MQEGDKAITAIKESPAQEFIKKADRRDKMFRAFEVIVLSFVMFFTVFTLIRIQYVIDQNKKDVLVAREANIDRQNELKDYLKCILLLKFDTTPEQVATREGAEAALDACAAGKSQ